MAYVIDQYVYIPSSRLLLPVWNRIRPQEETVPQKDRATIGERHPTCP
jgi:hypothetical protein